MDLTKSFVLGGTLLALGIGGPAAALAADSGTTSPAASLVQTQAGVDASKAPDDDLATEVENANGDEQSDDNAASDNAQGDDNSQADDNDLAGAVENANGDEQSDDNAASDNADNAQGDDNSQGDSDSDGENGD